MPTLLDSRIPTQAWRDRSDAHAVASGGIRPPAEAARAKRWEDDIVHLVAMRDLSDNWDGLGATAPTLEMLTCAVGLAYVLQEQGVDPPTRIVPGTDGTVFFEWQFPDESYGEIELVQPFHGEVMLLQPGKPAQHWTIPNA